jgi:hypothetical protein
MSARAKINPGDAPFLVNSKTPPLNMALVRGIDSGHQRPPDSHAYCCWAGGSAAGVCSAGFGFGFAFLTGGFG